MKGTSPSDRTKTDFCKIKRKQIQLNQSTMLSPKFLNVNINFMLISNRKVSIPFLGDAKLPTFFYQKFHNFYSKYGIFGGETEELV